MGAILGELALLLGQNRVLVTRGGTGDVFLPAPLCLVTPSYHLVIINIAFYSLSFAGA